MIDEGHDGNRRTEQGASGRAVVIVSSNRAAAGIYDDIAGPIVVGKLTEWGFRTGAPQVVKDGPPFERALRSAVDSRPDVIITSGGTGVSPYDLTPEMTEPLLTRKLPGLAEAIRQYGAKQGVPTAVLSRGLAGIAGTTVVINLPGSSGGVKDGLAVLEPVLGHVIDQVHGGDHPRTENS